LLLLVQQTIRRLPCFSRRWRMLSIYLDNNASTPVLPAVWDAMRPFLADVAGNPASSHHVGRRARQALEDARELTAALLGAFPDEVVFLSGATEANNLALFGLAGQPPGKIIASPLEHPSVSEPVLELHKLAFDVDYLPVDGYGVVCAGDLERCRQPATRLVTVMLANHETGAVEPVRELAQQLAGEAPLHCDAAAAAGKMAIHFHDLGAATLTISAHKFHGPKGVGALLVRRHTKLRPLLHGGHQQQGRRPGTEPVALAVGLAAALEGATKEREQRTHRVTELRALFLETLQHLAPPVVINGPESGGIPHTLNLSFPGCQADVLLMNLDLAGVCCATGSACSSGSLLPSPVLQAMGLPPERLHSAMRFSLSHLLSETEIIEATRRIAEVVNRLRDARLNGEAASQKTIPV
jgi:cysteine desulfurase